MLQTRTRTNGDMNEKFECFAVEENFLSYRQQSILPMIRIIEFVLSYVKDLRESYTIPNK